MDLRRAVSKTIRYADYFHFPLSPEEIHYWLVTTMSVPFRSIKGLLPPSMTSSQKRLRSAVSHSSKLKTLHARKLVKTLRFLPGLRLVALTGSVAAGNSHPHDDIDLLFVTSPYCLWLVRPVVIILMSLFFRRRHPGEDHSTAVDAFCPNLWLDSLSLSVPIDKRNLYTAHEVLQVVPLLDRGDTYRTFLYENRWTKKYLANAYTSLILQKGPRHFDRVKRVEKSHSMLIFYVLAPLNYLFYLIQLLYMSPKKTGETVHLHAAFLHTTDFAGAISHHLKTS